MAEPVEARPLYPSTSSGYVSSRHKVNYYKASNRSAPYVESARPRAVLLWTKPHEAWPLDGD